ncbi:hypothetical protein [Streptomyces laurentii]|uniref:hypothetical protein n=1 Tax=Streptomyces laurentii TaxID=39478 RepID=UPI0036C6A63B
MPDWMFEVLSEARLREYARYTRGDLVQAARLYRWNIKASKALFEPLHWFEVALRNAMHRELTAHYGRADWWIVAPLNDGGARRIRDARAKCRNEGKAGTPDQIVAELSLGFWRSLLVRSYDRTLWVPTLRHAFPCYGGRRDALDDAVWSLVLLRNRVMHHEPIHHRHLAEDHDKLYTTMGYLNQDLAKEIRMTDDFPAVLAARPDSLRGRLPRRGSERRNPRA